MEEDEIDLLAQQRFNKEEQEYLDARASYDAILGQVSSQMPIPYAMSSNYGVAQDGPQRASTDPWIREQHPDLANAGARVVLEQQDFLALDEPTSSHSEANCSIASYTANKIYEYYSALEMVYKLATDAAFRQSVASQLHAAYGQSAFANQQAADMLRWRAGHLDDDIEDAEAEERGDRSLMDRATSVFGFKDADEFYLWAQGYNSIEEWANDLPEGVVYAPKTAAELRAQREMLLEQARIHQDAAITKIKNFFTELWNDIKKRYAECGLMYAIITTGIDGAFLAAEFGAGLAVLRGLKFVRKITRFGKFKVELHKIEGGKVGEAEWTQDQLANKYGRPEQTKLGGYEPDANREIPDVPAEQAPARARTSDTEAEAPRQNARPQRSRDELLRNGRIPGKNDFDNWWDDLSPAELDDLWNDPANDFALRRTMERRIRGDGNLHEWLKVSQTPHLKKLGFSMDEIRRFTSPTRATSGPNPITGERWRHSTGTKGSTAPGSTQMHRSLDEIIATSSSRNELLRRYGYWANSWLDDGIMSFPPAMRDAILRAGGG